MTATSRIQPSDALGARGIQQMRCCMTSKARSGEATQLPPVLLRFSLWEKQSKKLGYSETAMLERLHVSIPVKGPAELLANCQHQLPATLRRLGHPALSSLQMTAAPAGIRLTAAARETPSKSCPTQLFLTHKIMNTIT